MTFRYGPKVATALGAMAGDEPPPTLRPGDWQTTRSATVAGSAAVDRPALAVDDRGLRGADARAALLEVAIPAGEGGDAEPSGGLVGGLAHRSGLPLLDAHRTPAPPHPGVRGPAPVLDAAVQLQHRRVAPGGVPGLLGDEVPVAAVPARLRRPRRHAAHAAHAAVGLGHEPPVTLAAQVLRPPRRVHHLRDVVGPTRLHHEHAQPGSSESRAATTQPDDPAPHTTTS